MIQNPGFLPDHSQNWITGMNHLCHARHSLKISETSVHNFLSYLANTQTNKQTKTGKNITSLAEVISHLYSFALSLGAPDPLVPGHQCVYTRRNVLRSLGALRGKVDLPTRRYYDSYIRRHWKTFIVAVTAVSYVLLDTALLTRYLTVDLFVTLYLFNLVSKFNL